MKDVTSTSFGLVIAFLLPGIALLYGASFWFDPLRMLCRDFLTAQSSVGLFLLLALLALTAGLLITPMRWLVFEYWRPDDQSLTADDFAQLGTDEWKLAAFRAAVDEHYRYHQFWGNMALAMPLVYAGLLRGAFPFQAWPIGVGLVLFLAFEALTVLAANHAYDNYVKRGKKILSGPTKHQPLATQKREDSYAKRMEGRQNHQDATTASTLKVAATAAATSPATPTARTSEEEVKSGRSAQ